MVKIILIGPIYPWRGGISHHTYKIFESLLTLGHDVKVVSFKRQYPHFLFPGSNQKEHSLPKSLYDRVVYSIDTLNPITWISTLRFILKEKPDLCVFKYWHFYFTPTYLFLLFFLKMTKIKLTSVVDNLFAHQENFLYNFLNLLSIKIFFYFINFSVTQSDYVSSQFKKFFPNKLEIMLAHPIYDIFGEKIDKFSARNILDLPSRPKILLFFGFIRKYKGLDILLEFFSQLSSCKQEIYLLIAGECFGSFHPYEKIIQDKLLSSFVIKHIFYIPNNNIHLYFSAADFLVMPYRTASNSGVMQIARYYNLPVIASDIDAFQAFKKDKGIYLVDFLKDTCNVLKIINKKNNFVNYDSNNEWLDFSRRMVDFFNC